VSKTPPTRDYFDMARAWAVTAMLVAGALAIAGSFMDWVTLTPPPVVPPEEAERLVPFTGLDARSGWYVIAAGIVLIVSAVLLYVRKKSGFAWLGFLASMAIGAIAISDYRGIGDLQSAIMRRTDVIGDAEPAIGIMLVALSALVGVIGSVAGVAASPAERASQQDAA
jgi:hypothetical protein